MDLSQLTFDEAGLIPAVVQDWRDGSVLMLGFMNREALQKTVETGSVHFFSRSRNRLWEKGETSGHRLIVRDLFVDCDRDTVLVKADPVGPTCHTGERSCFFSRLDSDGRPREEKTAEAWGGMLERVYQTILDRKRNPKEGSYVSTLFQGGPDRIRKKVVEEAGEVILASASGKREDVVYEAADVLFHLLLVLGWHDVTPQDVLAELAKRFGKPGLRADSTVEPKGGQP